MVEKSITSKLMINSIPLNSIQFNLQARDYARTSVQEPPWLQFAGKKFLCLLFSIINVDDNWICPSSLKILRQKNRRKKIFKSEILGRIN